MNLPTHLLNRPADSRRLERLAGQLRRNKGKGKADSAVFERAQGQDAAQEQEDHGETGLATETSAEQRSSADRNRRQHRDASNVGTGDEQQRSLKRACKKTFAVLRRHLAFVGPGIVQSVAYTDPGNWVTDLAAGSQFGYALLFIVLLSGLFGIFLQILAVRMGVVTGFDLARNTRMLLLPESRNNDSPTSMRRPSAASTSSARLGHSPAYSTSPRPMRFYTARRIALWILYGVSEGAIVATELAELLGSAIALNLLFPKLPLYAGVLITSADVLLILLVYRPNGNFRIFELLIGTLVLIVMACYVALLVRTKPNWPDVFHGYVPSATLIEAEALYTGVGIIGAVIMPHALYLGSHFSTINRTNSKANSFVSSPASDRESDSEEGRKNWFEMLRTLHSRVRERFPDLSRGSHHNGSSDSSNSSPHVPSHLQTTPRISSVSPLHNRMSIAEMRTHLPHAAWDIGLSLFFLAITVNSAILIVAAAAFHFNDGGQNPEVGDLFDAFTLLKNTLGHAYAILFAIALLAAGQAASITCTLAGQIVSEGFINWRTNPFIRRSITRLVTIIPSLAIAIAVGRSGLDQALVASQVALSFALPFVIVPLTIVTSMRSRMYIEEGVDEEATEPCDDDFDYFGSAPQAADAESVAPSTSGAPFHPDGRAAALRHGSDEIVPASPLSADKRKSHDASSLRRRSVDECKLQRTLTEQDAVDDGAKDEHQRQSASPRNVVATLRTRTISHNFTSGRIVTSLAFIVFLVIVVADVYTLITTFQGKQ